MRYARWDLRSIDLIDPQTQTRLCALYPLDKNANAEGRRRALSPAPPSPSAPGQTPPHEPAPLLQQLLADYAASGLPPAYLPGPGEATDE